MIKTCLTCSRDFKGRKERKFCSRLCQHRSSEWKGNIGRGNKGKLLGREDFKKKMSEVTSGSKNPRWVKDRSKISIRAAGVEKFLIDQWRKEVYRRDDYTCQICGKRGGRIQADHIKPVKLFPELIIDLNNGRTLCVSCHRKTPTFGSGVLSMSREDFL